MDKSGGIYIIYHIYVCMYTVAKLKYSTAYISGAIERKCIKLGQCGELLCIKHYKILGLHRRARSL